MPTRNSVDAKTIIKALSSRSSLSFRAVVYRKDNQWLTHTIHVVNGRHRTVKSGFRVYGDVGFIVKQASGKTIARWLQKLKITFDSVEILIPELQQSVQAERFPSHTSRYWMAEIYPFSTYRVGFSERDLRLNEFDPLISTTLPSFENLKAAVLHYVYDRESEREFSLPNDLTLQLHERDCWISKISLHPTSITVVVKGTNVRGARLELRVDRHHFEKRLNRSEHNVFSLEKGLGDKLWIVVSRKGKWLDYHETNLKYRSYSGNKEDQVKSYLDKQLELEAIVASGEGETTEFKIEVPESTETTKLMQSVCAFANTDGGVIIVGVEDKTGRIVGIKGNLNREKDRLTQIIRANLTHSPRMKIDRHDLNGVSVFVVKITKGENPPYGIKRDKPSYYVRRGATNVAASPEEMRLLVANQSSTYSQLTGFRN